MVPDTYFALAAVSTRHRGRQCNGSGRFGLDLSYSLIWWLSSAGLTELRLIENNDTLPAERNLS